MHSVEKRLANYTGQMYVYKMLGLKKMHSFVKETPFTLGLIRSGTKETVQIVRLANPLDDRASMF